MPRFLLLTLALCLLLPGGATAAAPDRGTAKTGREAAGPELVGVATLQVARVIGRARPTLAAEPVRELEALSENFEAVFYPVVGELVNRQGARWLRLVVPGRPNGRTAWVPAEKAVMRKPRYEIVIRRGARTLELRLEDALLLRARVAVGAPRTETPTGIFVVEQAFFPASQPYLGSWAFATSGYAPVSDWPGGIVGIHGTQHPELLGQAVSHGCVRVSNEAVLQLKRYVRPGTPVIILP